jgi:hypothetical protein
MYRNSTSYKGVRRVQLSQEEIAKRVGKDRTTIKFFTTFKVTNCNTRECCKEEYRWTCASFAFVAFGSMQIEFLGKIINQIFS